MLINSSVLYTTRNWIRCNLLNTWNNAIITIFLITVLLLLLPKIYLWAVADAVLTLKVDPESWWGYTFVPDSDACRKASGACWDFITEKFSLIMFGLYPPDQHWRPLVMMISLIFLVVYSLDPSRWGRALGIIWIIAIPVMFFLMQGGVLGLTFVQTDSWGGAPITLILATVGIVLSFPIAIMLALGRQSNMTIVKTICIFFIEIVRGVPLITVLFMASLMIPLFLPEGININKLLRALIGFTLFSAAYVAEVIRGGLQALPKGQYEAADSMGLTYWQKTGLVILPQALKLVIPPTMNTFIGLFKDTTLIIIISMYDFLGTVRLGASDPTWRPYYVEGLIFAAIVYFTICYAMAAYSQHLEAKLNPERS
ncbi:MAG: Inner membrane amino-acid ABC transporter permease protein YhdY [Hyphomicrobiaceae bacterium hypho_1]